MNIMNAILMEQNMNPFESITFNPDVMGGKPCVQGMRVTVAMVLGRLAVGITRKAILDAVPCVELAEVESSLVYAARRVEEREVPLTQV
jgi:uncharacterized protein (DUF433 family)